MSILLPHPRFQKTLRYIAAYALFIFFALLGLPIIMGLRSDIYNLCAIFKVHPNTAYLLYSWGTYLMFFPYILLIGFLEPYLNKAAAAGQVLARAKKVLLIEGGLAVIIFLVMLIAALTNYPPVI